MPILEATGRPVFAVALTGHGARRHLSGPHVNLTDHVNDVVGVVRGYDFTNITLVGHSYGGRVISKAWEQLSDRIASMVYVDAHAPFAEADAGQSDERQKLAEDNGGMLPFVNYKPDPKMVGGDEGVDWFMARVMPQSWRCVTDPWHVELPDELRKTFVFASAEIGDRFHGYAEAAKAHDSWDYLDLPGRHFLMVTHPAELSACIIEADGVGPSQISD